MRCRAIGTGAEMLLDEPRLFSGQLAVDEWAQVLETISASHPQPTFREPPRALARRSRARDKRDITVPIGAPVMSLIWRYDISFSSRSTKTSFSSGGSASTAD